MVTYGVIAPYVGLEPKGGCRDASTFAVDRARIPTPLFQKIVEDIQLMMKQYGPPIDHQNEKARSRFLAP
jgi:hypothetical protein